MDDPRPITVDPAAAGMRADVYLAHRFALYSRSGAAEAIRSGEVVSTSRTLKPASLLKAGEVLHIHRRMEDRSRGGRCGGGARVVLPLGFLLRAHEPHGSPGTA